MISLICQLVRDKLCYLKIMVNKIWEASAHCILSIWCLNTKQIQPIYYNRRTPLESCWAIHSAPPVCLAPPSPTPTALSCFFLFEWVKYNFRIYSLEPGSLISWDELSKANDYQYIFYYDLYNFLLYR